MIQTGTPSVSELNMMRAVKTPDAKNATNVKKAAQEFQAVYLSEMMNYVFSGIKTSPLFGGGHGEETFRSMLVQEYANNLAKTDQLKMNGALQKQIHKLQGEQ